MALALTRQCHRSCVCSRTWQQQLYVGETEDVGQRLATHRATETRERKRLQAAAEPLPGGCCVALGRS